MASKQDEHNRGQEDGAQANGFDELIEINNPFTSNERKQGFLHGRRQKIEAEARVPVQTGSAPPSGSTGASFGSGGAAGGTGAGVGSFIVLLVIALWVVLLVLNTHTTTYKPTTLPTAMTSGPSGTTFHTGDGDPLAFQAYNDGRYFLNLSKYNQAIPYFSESIRRQPDYYAFVGRADAYRFLGKNDLALQDYDQAVRLGPSKPQGYLGRGIVKDLLGRDQEAIDDINRGLTLNPTEMPDVYYRVRAIAYLHLGQFQNAIDDCNKTLRLKPDDPVATANRGTAYSRIGQDESALQDYDRAVYLDPHDAALRLGRGVVYERLGQYEHAIQDFDEAIRLNPNLTEVYTDLQDAKARMGATAAGNEDSASTTNDSTAANTEEVRSSSQNSVPPQNQVGSKFSDCYSGTWHQNESNRFTWNFRRAGSYLQISRTDGFVSGQFQKSSDGWTGFLNWRVGTRWNGVILHEANEACDEITTNQRWWYKR